MKYEITDRVLAILRENPARGPKLEKSLRELLGISTADLEEKNQEDEMASKVAQAIADQLGLEKPVSPAEREKEMLKTMYPSVADIKTPPEPPEPLEDAVKPALNIYTSMKD